MTINISVIADLPYRDRALAHEISQFVLRAAERSFNLNRDTGKDTLETEVHAIYGYDLELDYLDARSGELVNPAYCTDIIVSLTETRKVVLQ